MTVLIAGCGDLGTQAGLYFAAAGHRVVGWRRSAAKLPAQIEGVSADLTGKLPPIPRDTDVVVIALTADGRSREAYRATYYNGSANLLDALDRNGVSPRRIIFVSSTAVYGNDDGAWIDEETAPSPSTETGSVLRETEEMLAERAPQTVLLRLSGIYGPGRTRLLDQVRTGRAQPQGAPQWTNRIHRDDAAAAIVHLAALPEALPAYCGTDNEPAVLAEVLAFLASELGEPVPTVPAGGLPATGKRIRNARLTASGYSFRYPTYREGYRSVLAGVGSRYP